MALSPGPASTCSGRSRHLCTIHPSRWGPQF
jgi:hypothetical protein